MKHEKLTNEQITALMRYATKHGRYWKAALGNAWETGIYSTGDNVPALQQLRNNYGPSWLMKANLKGIRLRYIQQQTQSITDPFENPKRRPRAGMLAAHARAIAPKIPRKPKADSKGFFPVGTRKQREAWEYHYGIGYSTRKGAAKNPARMARRARPKVKRIAMEGGYIRLEMSHPQKSDLTVVIQGGKGEARRIGAMYAKHGYTVKAYD